MSVAASKVVALAQLRVAIYAPDLLRQENPETIGGQKGAICVVSDWDFADVILSDGNPPVAEARPTVTLGGGDHHSPGVLHAMRTRIKYDLHSERLPFGPMVHSPDATDIGFGSMPESDIRT